MIKIPTLLLLIAAVGVGYASARVGVASDDYSESPSRRLIEPNPPQVGELFIYDGRGFMRRYDGRPCPENAR